MTWQARSMEEQRKEFVRLAPSDTILAQGVVPAFRDQFQVRLQVAGARQAGTGRLDGRPLTSATDLTLAHRSPIEARVLALRLKHPSWVWRKLSRKGRTATTADDREDMTSRPG